MKRFIKKAATQLRQLGFSDALALVKSSLFCNEVLLVHEFAGDRPDRARASDLDGVEVRRGTVEDLERNMDRFDPVPWELQCHLYDGVEDFVIAVGEAGEIQHVCWVYYQGDPNRFIRLGPRDAEIKYGLTPPEYRGRGIFPRVLEAIVANVTAEGIERVYTCIKRENRASLRGAEKAGFAIVGRVRLVKVMGVQLSRRYRPAVGR